jgi:16S rRNA (adenine(1408)-N(1))-methyltransferase
VADRVTIILPWGSLLRTVAAPDLDSLHHIARLCLSDADVDIVLSYDEERDARQRILFPGGAFDHEHIASLTRAYREAGIQVATANRLSQKELASLETTWAKRLAFGRPRGVWRIRAKYAGTTD